MGINGSGGGGGGGGVFMGGNVYAFWLVAFGLLILVFIMSIHYTTKRLTHSFYNL